jgi:hypothetical protein
MVSRNPSTLRINNNDPSFKNSRGQDVKVKEALKYRAAPNENIIAPVETEPLSTSETARYFEETEREIKRRYEQAKRDAWVEWDAVLAELQLADSEDMTSSAWRAFKWRSQKPISVGPNLPEVTGEELNKQFPPMEKYGEEKLDPKKKFNEVQQMMFREQREYRRGLIDRAGQGKDTPAQYAANLGAQILGGGTVGDIALALVAPQAEAAVAGARFAPHIVKAMAKSLQAIRKSKGLKGTMFVNMLEHAISELGAIPTENVARKDVGVKEYGAMEIAARVTMGMLFTAGITSFAHVIKNSAFWRNLFEKDPKEAVKKFNSEVKKLKDGIPYNEERLLDSWEQMSPEDKADIIKDEIDIGEFKLGDGNGFDNSEEILGKYVDELLEIDHQEKLAAFEKKADTEGLEAPKKESYSEINKDYEKANIQLKSRITDLVNCLKG